MGKSWNQKWRKINDAPAPHLHKWGDGTLVGFRDHECTTTKCYGKQIVAQTTYSYVTGRQGRTTSAYKFVCEDHLAKFLKKNPEAIEALPVRYEDGNRKFSLED
jgi:hypothetical protein